MLSTARSFRAPSGEPDHRPVSPGTAAARHALAASSARRLGSWTRRCVAPVATVADRRGRAAARRRRDRPARSPLVPGARPGDDRVPGTRRVRPPHPADRTARTHRRVPQPGQPPGPAQLLPARPDVPPARLVVVGAGGGDGRRSTWRRSPPPCGSATAAAGSAGRDRGARPCSPSSIRGYGQLLLTQPWNPYLPLLAWIVVLLAVVGGAVRRHDDARPGRRGRARCAPRPTCPYLVPARGAGARAWARGLAGRPRIGGSDAWSPWRRRSASCCGCPRSSTSSTNDPGNIRKLARPLRLAARAGARVRWTAARLTLRPPRRVGRLRSAS